MSMPQFFPPIFWSRKRTHLEESGWVVCSSAHLNLRNKTVDDLIDFLFTYYPLSFSSVFHLQGLRLSLNNLIVLFPPSLHLPPAVLEIDKRIIFIKHPLMKNKCRIIRKFCKLWKVHKYNCLLLQTAFLARNNIFHPLWHKRYRVPI